MDENSDDLLIISKKWGTGRGKHTSVERFCELLDPAFPSYHGQRVSVHPWVSRIFKKWTNSKKSNNYTAPYNSYSFELELWGLRQALKKRYHYVFFPYADYDYYYWRYFKKFLGMKVILWTYFSEKELAGRFKNLSHFEQADLVLVAGQAQLDYLRGHAKKIHATYFPIGVDTKFFTPGSDYDPYRIVHVGNNRRDFETLIAGMDLVYQEYPQIKLELVGASASRDRIPDRPYLTIHDHMDDVHYREILQCSNFAILSLEDGGSSNSLLETCACGLPLVVTDLPNVRDYLDEDSILRFEPRNYVTLASQILSLLQNPKLRNKISERVRYYVLRFDWNKCRQEFIKIINHL